MRLGSRCLRRLANWRRSRKY